MAAKSFLILRTNSGDGLLVETLGSSAFAETDESGFPKAGVLPELMDSLFVSIAQ